MSALIQPVKSDATQPAMAANGDATLGVGTYYYYFGACAEVHEGGIQLKWDAVLAADISLESCLWDEVSAPLVSTVAGDWLPVNPPDAYVPVAGGTSVGALVNAPGGSAGGCSYELSGFNMERGRLKLVVGTGGVARVGVGGKR